VNNIEAVRQRLDELYRNMEVDEMVQILREHEPENESDSSEPHQFEIVFVCAERLLPMDSNEASDPFIVLSHDSKDLFRSKTIYANINPRWNEVYEVTLTKEVTYLVRIYDSDKVHKNRLCGWQHLSIDPQDYEDYMPHDVWLDLSQVGRLLLRITMRGERDDIQFFFGRTFRSLKRKEADMSGMIVDAVRPFNRMTRVSYHMPDMNDYSGD
jgi:Ca2+-dependent lipid-binding protein